ncbi:hypothetical protein [Buttiauxella gaviniae]|uniref:hypothetical protein n=1 Tax=Buttiauxella gaviniae TaxID=82990 RepID=UPI003C7752E9
MSCRLTTLLRRVRAAPSASVASCSVHASPAFADFAGIIWKPWGNIGVEGVMPGTLCIIRRGGGG